MGVSGSCSEGLSTKPLPQATASGNIQSGIMAGKLNGVMPTHTPSGCTQEWPSTRRATLPMVSPRVWLAMAQACSTTSMPRHTSPLASARFLPVSWASRVASSS